MPNAVTSYDLISINGVSLPDVRKGTISVQPNPKYTEYDCEDGGKVIDVIEQDKIRGTVSYDGLLQSQITTIMAAIDLVSTLTIYNPLTNNTKTVLALILVSSVEKKIHDGRANAWSFGFDFEEIGNVT